MDFMFPTSPHCALIAGPTSCGKTRFVLNLLENQYRGVFDYIIILCPTIRDNETYLERSWIWTTPNVVVIEKCDRLNHLLGVLFERFRGEKTLYLVDDLAGSDELAKKRDMLTKLAFSGRHTQQSVWVLTQAYTSVLKDFRRQTKWVALFHPKERDDFLSCLRENDVVPADVREEVRAKLSQVPHAKLILKTDVPASYIVHVPSG
jgi:hypothetical protein